MRHPVSQHKLPFSPYRRPYIINAGVNITSIEEGNNVLTFLYTSHAITKPSVLNNLQFTDSGHLGWRAVGHALSRAEEANAL